MAAVNVILPSKEVRRINAVAGTSLLKALQAAGIYIPAICGGKGSCGKCRLRLASGTLPVTDADRACFSSDELNGGWRLACAAFPSGDITAELPETGESNFYAVENFEQKQAALNVSCKSFSPQKIPQSFARQLEPGRRLSYPELLEASKLAEPPPGNDLHAYRDGNARVIRIGGENEAVYAAAVDLGTTTLGFSLVNLRSGDVNCRYSAVNKQREYGGDVITRIQKANDGGLSALSQCAREQIAGGITALCSDAGIALKDIHKIAVAGNTTMLHLLLGLSCQTLGKTPFTPVTLDMVFLNHRELFDEEFSSGLNPGCEVVILPGISTYVGADITAGLFYSEFHKTADAALFLDIGTNGEMALARDGKILCAATAAGPAFEGGNILCGTGSVPGAISGVKCNNGVFSVDTIGNKAPAGICGSGVVDTVYQGLMHGYIQKSGRYTGKVKNNEIFLAKSVEGRDIVFCQKDVRELQLGKSAIRSGLDALLNHCGLGYDDIKTLYIAGGFGFNLDMESAAGIGLIPPALLSKVSLGGNSALGGTVKYLLNSGSDGELDGIIGQSSEFSLPEDRYFNEHFVENVNFD